MQHRFLQRLAQLLAASTDPIIVADSGFKVPFFREVERLRASTRKRRAYSRLFLARLLLTLEHCKTAAAHLADAIGPLDQWVASDHAALLAE